MKLLSVYGDDDYAVLSLQQSDLYQRLDYRGLYNLAIEKGDEHAVFEFEEGCYMEAYEFPGVVLTDEFIEWLNGDKDYDTTKHHDWFIVEKE